MAFSHPFQCSKCILMLGQRRLSMLHPCCIFYQTLFSLEILNPSKHVIISSIFCVSFLHVFGWFTNIPVVLPSVSLYGFCSDQRGLCKATNWKRWWFLVFILDCWADSRGWSSVNDNICRAVIWHGGGSEYSRVNIHGKSYVGTEKTIWKQPGCTYWVISRTEKTQTKQNVSTFRWSFLFCLSPPVSVSSYHIQLVL